MSTKPDLPASRKSDVDELISVLLPLYNAEFSLVKCLESILNQTYRQFEVIAVDDGSSDSTLAILNRFAASDDRVKVFHLPQNQGVVAALNFGLKQCRGPWVARMDGDDLMRPQRLEKQYQYIKQNPTVNIVGCRIHLFRYRGELTPGQIKYRDWSNRLISDDEIKSNIFAESPIMHPTFFLSLQFYREMGGYLDQPWAEDYDFLLRAYLQQACFAKLPETLIDKGDHPARLARTDPRCKRQSMFEAKSYYFARDRSWQPHQKKIWVIGTGSAGKMTCQALTNQNIRIAGFVGQGASEKVQTLLGYPVRSITRETASAFFTRERDGLYLLAIGLEESREKVENLLQDLGFSAGREYLRFI